MSTGDGGTPAAQSRVKIHADFSKPTRTALLSSDEVVIYVSLSQLAGSSSFFRGMVEDATPGTSQSTSPDVIPVSEDSKTLELLLKLALGMAVNKLNERWTCPADIEPVLDAARKYDFPGTAQILLGMIELSALRLKNPLAQYIVACRHNLATLRSEAFERCLGTELDLSALEGPIEGRDIAALVKAHRMRVKILVGILLSQNEGDGPFAAENRTTCARCRTSAEASALGAWSTFQRLAVAVITVRPSLEALWADAKVNEARIKLQQIQCPVQQCKVFMFVDIQRMTEVAWTSRKVKVTGS